MSEAPKADSRMRWFLIALALLAFSLIAGGATQIGHASDAPRVLGLWEMKGLAVTALAAVAFTGSVLLTSAQPAQRRRRAFGFLAAMFALGGMWLALECGALLRLIDYRLVLATQFSKPWENPRNVLDPELLYRHPPHEHFVGAVPGDLVAWYGIPTDRRYPVDFRYDHRGFRNQEDREHADIVMIGDSKVEGSLVPYPQIASAQLEQRLSVPVLNLGQIGYSPQQCAIVLKRYGIPAAPKVVVWLLFEGNDLTLDFERYDRTISDFDNFVRQAHGLYARSFSRNLFLTLARWTAPPSTENLLRGLNRSCTLTHGTEAGERLYFAYKPIDVTTVSTDQLRAPLQSIAEGRQACADAGVNFLLVFVPIKYRVYHDHCVLDPNSESAGWTLHDIPGIVGDWAAQHDIQYIDLTPDLRDRAAAGELVYYLDDGHWTAVGHRVAATRIAEKVKNNGWLHQANAALD